MVSLKLVLSVVNIFPSAALTAAQNKTKTLPVGRESTHDFQNIIMKKEENKIHDFTVHAK
jgi:hypothetical protein